MKSQKFLRGSKITGSGHYYPDKILTNFDLEKMVDTTDEWIVTRTGVKERRIIHADQAASDLAYNASVIALEEAGLKAENLDAIVVGTVTADMQFPSTACVLQDRLNAKNAAAFDVGAACSGFIYSLNVAHSMVASGQMDRILVIGVEALTKFVDWSERTTCVLFGDGAGAAIIEPCEPGDGILGTYMKSDGSLAELLWIPAGGSRTPTSETSYSEGGHYIRMKGDGVFKYAVRAMIDATNRVLDQAGMTVEDVDWLIPHQANIRIIDAIAERLHIPKESIVVNLDRLGNTSSASVPIAYDEVVQSGKMKKGDNIIFVAFGGGFTWGAVLLRHTR